MNIIEPYVKVPEINGPALLKNIELYGRVCYKSEDKMTENSYEGMIRSLLKLGHESVIEHEKITVCFVVDRGVSHELVRHRIASFSQSSTRYCNYSNDKFGNEITVINPFFFDENSEEYKVWHSCCKTAEVDYIRLIGLGRSPQEARSILPNSLMTEVVTTFNLREWRHFFRLRCDAAAHPQMRQVAIPLLCYFREVIPILFDDISYDEKFDSNYYAEIVKI